MELEHHLLVTERNTDRNTYREIKTGKHNWKIKPNPGTVDDLKVKVLPC